MTNFDILKTREWAEKGITIKSGEWITHALFRAWLEQSDGYTRLALEKQFQQLGKENRKAIMSLAKEILEMKQWKKVQIWEKIQIAGKEIPGVDSREWSHPYAQIEENREENPEETPSKKIYTRKWDNGWKRLPPEKVVPAAQTAWNDIDAESLSVLHHRDTTEVLPPTFSNKEIQSIRSIFKETLGWDAIKEISINEKLWTIMRKQADGSYYLWDTIKSDTTRDIYYLDNTGNPLGRFTMDAHDTILSSSKWIQRPRTLTYKPSM